MVPRPRSPPVRKRFSNEILDAIEKCTNNEAMSLEDIEDLLKHLRFISEAVAKGGAASNVQQWRKEVHWKQCMSPLYIEVGC